ncbi:putative RNA-directed DNA polymerase from transposon BS [Trichonephila clavipes]|nr:putative RNA-directed DNA polymerase from transposon BS [Trichonephila clavipes]
MTRKSPFAIQKALKGIGGDRNQLNCPLIVTPHRSLNSCRGVISEPDLLCASEAEILEGFSDQGVTQVRRIKIKKDSSLFPTKHLILTFNSPKLPSTIKAGYLNCKIRPYIPNPLRCFKCQRFGHSQTSCRGQLTCSRSAAVGHFSTDCTLELKCINCLQAHCADSKLCPKWKAEKQMQEIKTNKNITYIEARKLIAPLLTLTYSQAAKSSITSTSTQTDENITKIKCPPLELLQPASSNSKQNKTTPIPTVSTSFSSTQAHLLRSTSTISKSQPPIPKIPISNDLPSTIIPSTSAILPTIQKEALLPMPILTSTTTSSAGNSLNTSASSLKTDTRLFPTTSNKFAALSTEIQPSVSLSESEATASNNEPSYTSKISKRLKRNSKNRKRRAKEQKAEIEVQMTPHTPKKSYIHYDSEEEDMIIHNVDEKLMDDHVRSGYSHFLTPTRNRRN